VAGKSSVGEARSGRPRSFPVERFLRGLDCGSLEGLAKVIVRAGENRFAALDHRARRPEHFLHHHGEGVFAHVGKAVVQRGGFLELIEEAHCVSPVVP
jgi:hypothetical protein